VSTVTTCSRCFLSATTDPSGAARFRSLYGSQLANNVAPKRAVDLLLVSFEGFSGSTARPGREGGDLPWAESIARPLPPGDAQRIVIWPSEAHPEVAPGACEGWRKKGKGSQDFYARMISKPAVRASSVRTQTGASPRRFAPDVSADSS
jgi:hypothetical protein